MYQECLKLVFKSVSRVVKGSFMGVSIAFVFIEVIAATRANGGLVLVEKGFGQTKDFGKKTFLAKMIICKKKIFFGRIKSNV